MSESEWEKAAGAYCPNCHRETFRLVPLLSGRTGCPACAGKEQEKLAKAEASLGPVADSVEESNPRLARRIRRYLRRKALKA